MKFTKKQMNLEEGLNKEWIITNGIGGFASSTIIGCNTRKYHGLLVAPLTPPARRFLFLSKLDESIEIDGSGVHNLYTNMCENYISDGYKYLESFEKDYIPIFSYKIGDITIKKMICMKYGENTVCVLYRIKNGKKKAKFTVAPIVNFRDFHQTNENHIYSIKQEVKKHRVKVIVDNNSETPIYMTMNDGEYIEHNNDIFYNMYYMEEEKRGFNPKENHSVVGRYEIPLMPGEEKEVSFVCSLHDNVEEIKVKKVISDEIVRINQLLIDSNLVELEKNKVDSEERELLKNYIIASDNFIVYRPTFRLHTMIAGYPWFLDWGRDAMISYEGLLLIPRRYEIAKEVLLTFTKSIKFGLVPNGYSGFDNRPLYNSVDASLLLFEQVKKLLSYTNDYDWVKKNIYDNLREIIEKYTTGIDLDDNNIYLDSDYLLVSGTPRTQNTWMDAKYDGIAVTPRNGKAVEINALWYNALKIMEELTLKFEGKKEAKKYAELAENCRISYNEKFYNKRRKCLYDVLGDDKIRPNQLFSLALTYPVIEPNSDIANQVFETVTKKLLNKYGLKTLAKGEENYVELYYGEPARRDMSYHQGITWPWLLGLYYNALKNMINSTKNKKEKEELKLKLDEFKKNVKATFIKSFNTEGMIGSLSELHDSKAPYLPKGATAQAWSVAEIFRIILSK